MKKFFVEPGKECAQAWELMPWVLQDSASEEQEEWLIAHLAHCPSCAAEFAQQSRLRRAMSLPSDVPLDPEAGLQKLFEQLDAPRVPARQAAPPPTGHWAFKALAATALIQAIALGAMGLRVADRPQGADYRTLSDAAPPSAAGTVRVVPDAQMSLADWDALLQTRHLQVVAGPNEVGAYTIAPAPNALAASPEATAQQLRALPGIRLAEPIATP